jgi:hypothetical protein
MNTPTTDNDGAEKAPSPLMQHLRKVLADDSAFEAAKKEARVILEAARRINAASPVGQDALAAALKRIEAELLNGNKAITDTVWMSDTPNETMLECVQHALDLLASASHANPTSGGVHPNPTSGGPGAGGVADGDLQQHARWLYEYAKRGRDLGSLPMTIAAKLETIACRILNAGKSTPPQGDATAIVDVRYSKCCNAITNSTLVNDGFDNERRICTKCGTWPCEFLPKAQAPAPSSDAEYNRLRSLLCCNAIGGLEALDALHGMYKLRAGRDGSEGKRQATREKCADGECAKYRNFNGGCDVCGAPCL